MSRIRLVADDALNEITRTQVQAAEITGANASGPTDADGDLI